MRILFFVFASILASACAWAQQQQMARPAGQETPRTVAQKFSGWRDHEPLSVQPMGRKPVRKGQDVFEPEDQVEDLEGPGPGATGNQGNFGE